MRFIALLIKQIKFANDELKRVSAANCWAKSKFKSRTDLNDLC